MSAFIPGGYGAFAALGAGMPQLPAQRPPGQVSVSRTQLTPDEESKYLRWRSTLPQRLQYEGDYDLRGFWKKYPDFAVNQPEQHMTDEFKLPNHPTFSNESQYYQPSTAHLGGAWQGNSYIPNDTQYKKRVDE